jgi:hypothetical protein
VEGLNVIVQVENWSVVLFYEANLQLAPFENGVISNTEEHVIVFVRIVIG